MHSSLHILYLTSLGLPSLVYTFALIVYSKLYAHLKSRRLNQRFHSKMSRYNGRVQLIDGDFYFSPNSQRTVNLPPIYNDFPSRDSFSEDFAEFRQPHWWQPACPYLAFIPLRPVFAGVPFQDLFHISYFHRLHYGPFGLDPQIILGWEIGRAHV